MSSMPKKQKVEVVKQRKRNWTADEKRVFCEILVDPNDGFIYKLERLVLNKFSNRELFEQVFKQRAI